MRQIVTGLFETYDDALRAQDALLLKGFATSDIELPLRGTVAANPAAGTRESVLAGIERFISSLFATTANPGTPGAAEDDARAAALRDALRRGAVLVGVYANDDATVAAARDTLLQQRARQVDEHPPGWAWSDSGPNTTREHSALDELGIGGLAAAMRPKAPPSATNDATRADSMRAQYEDLQHAHGQAEPMTTPADDAAVTALASASAPGAGAIMGTGAPVVPPAPAEETAATDSAVPTSDPIPDEFVEYEEDFRAHHATQYAEPEIPYEHYQDAYRYGAAIARDTRYRELPWSDVEADARRGWEEQEREAAAAHRHHAWERIRDAVRHGWSRVSGGKDS